MANSNCFKILILTPFATYLEGEATFLNVTSSDYVLGILPNHAPLITTLITSIMKIKFLDKEESFAIGGGVLHIKKNNEVLLLLNSVERASEIDQSRAQKAIEKAEAILNDETKSNVEKQSAKEALNRAKNRLKLLNIH